jgi:hypothetical protein
MDHIANYVRIFTPNPTDDLVDKRTDAIDEIAKAFRGQTTVRDILRSANDLAIAAQVDGPLSEYLSKIIEAAIRKSSTAFVAEKDTAVEMLVCGLCGALQALTNGTPTRHGETTVVDVLSLGLWSALSFQKPRTEAKLEKLRHTILETAQVHCARAGSQGRRRVQVGDPEFKLAPKKTPTAETPTAEEDAELDADAVNLGLAPFRTAVADLRANAAIDREEIELLWWVLSDWSTLLKRRFSTEKGAVAVVASGLEVGRMIRRIPAEAHRHLVLRNVPVANAFSLQEVVSAVGNDRSALATVDTENLIAQYPAVFPLLSALNTGSTQDTRAKTKRPVGEWADRALLESAIHRICNNIPSVSV